MGKNFFKHLHVVNSHRWKVFLFSCKVGIPLQGLVHDMSKYSYLEFSISQKYYQGTSSPIFEERKHNNSYSEVAVHHQNNNKHHYEYWIDVYKGEILIKNMPFKYALEMVIDMISASMTYQKKNFVRGYVLDYFNERKDKYLMHPGTKDFITYTLNLYKESDFKYLKKKPLKAKYDEFISFYPPIIFYTLTKKEE